MLGSDRMSILTHAVAWLFTAEAYFPLSLLKQQKDFFGGHYWTPGEQRGEGQGLASMGRMFYHLSESDHLYDILYNT